MKKAKLKKIITWLDDFIRMNERHMQIQDGAIIRKDEEILVANTAANELKIKLEETQEALSRSRNFVRIIQSDKRRSIKDMAESIYILFNQNKAYKKWEFLIEEEKEHWMWLVVEIISWEKIIRR